MLVSPVPPEEACGGECSSDFSEEPEEAKPKQPNQLPPVRLRTYNGTTVRQCAFHEGTTSPSKHVTTGDSKSERAFAMSDADLDRFVDAQAKVHRQVEQELTDGHKRTHWMWFIFPQLLGLGLSPMA